MKWQWWFIWPVRGETPISHLQDASLALLAVVGPGGLPTIVAEEAVLRKQVQFLLRRLGLLLLRKSLDGAFLTARGGYIGTPAARDKEKGYQVEGHEAGVREDAVEEVEQQHEEAEHGGRAEEVGDVGVEVVAQVAVLHRDDRDVVHDFLQNEVTHHEHRFLVTM